MSVLTREELMNKINDMIGESDDDVTISFIEDVTDTLTDLENKANGDGVDWKEKYEQNDAEWRKKYKDRFFNSGTGQEPDPEPDPEPEPEPITFDELFKED